MCELRDRSVGTPRWYSVLRAAALRLIYLCRWCTCPRHLWCRKCGDKSTSRNTGLDKGSWDTRRKFVLRVIRACVCVCNVFYWGWWFVRQKLEEQARFMPKSHIFIVFVLVMWRQSIYLLQDVERIPIRVYYLCFNFVLLLALLCSRQHFKNVSPLHLHEHGTCSAQILL